MVVMGSGGRCGFARLIVGAAAEMAARLPGGSAVMAKGEGVR